MRGAYDGDTVAKPDSLVVLPEINHKKLQTLSEQKKGVSLARLFLFSSWLSKLPLGLNTKNIGFTLVSA